MSPLPAPPQPLDPLVELIQAPQMASVRHLEDALGWLRLALLAQHPCLVCRDNYLRRDGPSTLRRARDVLRKASSLHDALVRYTTAVHDDITPNADPDDFPF